MTTAEALLEVTRIMAARGPWAQFWAAQFLFSKMDAASEHHFAMFPDDYDGAEEAAEAEAEEAVELVRNVARRPEADVRRAIASLRRLHSPRGRRR